MIPAKPFYMIRHGETEANVKRIIVGQVESPLTDLGRQEARSLQKVVMSIEKKPSAIIHSSLSRARDTATILNEALNAHMHEEPDFVEIDYGDQAEWPYEKCENLLYDYGTPLNGETFKDFFERIEQAINRTLEHHNSPVLIVSHGQVFRAMGGIYGLNVLKIPGNCQLCEFTPAPNKTPFPWDVYSYEYDEEQNRVIRTKESIYDNCEIYGEE